MLLDSSGVGAADAAATRWWQPSQRRATRPNGLFNVRAVRNRACYSAIVENTTAGCRPQDEMLRPDWVHVFDML